MFSNPNRSVLLFILLVRIVVVVVVVDDDDVVLVAVVVTVCWTCLGCDLHLSSVVGNSAGWESAFSIDTGYAVFWCLLVTSLPCIVMCNNAAARRTATVNVRYIHPHALLLLLLPLMLFLLLLQGVSATSNGKPIVSVPTKRSSRKTTSSSLTPNQLTLIEESFERADKHNANVLDAGEVRNALKYLGIVVTKQQVSKLILEVDVDYTETIDVEEFIEMCAPMLPSYYVQEEGFVAFYYHSTQVLGSGGVVVVDDDVGGGVVVDDVVVVDDNIGVDDDDVGGVVDDVVVVVVDDNIGVDDDDVVVVVVDDNIAVVVVFVQGGAAAHSTRLSGALKHIKLQMSGSDAQVRHCCSCRRRCCCC